MIVRKTRIVVVAIVTALLWVTFFRDRFDAYSYSYFRSTSSGNWGYKTSHGSPSRRNGFQFVDPLIGTLNGGHVFPGATLPFGEFIVACRIILSPSCRKDAGNDICCITIPLKFFLS
jgi:hypothetical protein